MPSLSSESSAERETPFTTNHTSFRRCSGCVHAALSPFPSAEPLSPSKGGPKRQWCIRVLISPAQWVLIGLSCSCSCSCSGPMSRGGGGMRGWGEGRGGGGACQVSVSMSMVRPVDGSGGGGGCLFPTSDGCWMPGEMLPTLDRTERACNHGGIDRDAGAGAGAGSHG